VANLTPEQFASIQWPAGWRYVRTGEGVGYEDALEKEVGEGHPLFNSRVIAVGARVDRDDVLVLLPGSARPLAVVHLTYADAPDPDDPTLPRTTFYNSLEAWLQNPSTASPNTD
jgi:hypothetical protein